MRVVVFCHSLVSCWNHGNAHFLRGVVRELGARGHEVRRLRARRRLEPREPGPRPGRGGARRLRARPTPTCRARDATPADARTSTRRWTGPTSCWSTSGTSPSSSPPSAGAGAAGGALHAAVPRHPPPRGERPASHRAASTSTATTACWPSARCCASVYLAQGWARRVWTWHEAADTALFRPLPDVEPRGGPGLGRQLGRRRADARSCAHFLLEPVKHAGPRRPRPRRPLSRRTR